MRSGTDDAIYEGQCGYRSGRECVELILAVGQMCEKYLAKGKYVYWAFMDLNMVTILSTESRCGRFCGCID